VLQSLSPANASERRDSDGGFSLVEIMVALAIFLVASGAVLGLIMVSLSTIRANADRVYAASLARAELDSIRLLPADQIPIGTQDPREVSTDAGDFTISVTTGWSALPDDAVSQCNVGEGYILGGKAYVNARVSVSGGELGGPQVVDAVIYPNDAGSNAIDGEDAKTGTMTIFVADVDGNPVEGAGVSGRLLGTPLDDGIEQIAQTFPEAPEDGITGAEGCEFVSELKTSADWKVTLDPPAGYITESLEGLVQDKVVDALLNTPVNFVVARPSTVMFAVSESTNITSQVIEFSRADQDSASDSVFVDPGVTQSDLWPGTYTAWLRPCEGSVDGTVASAVVGQGETATVTIDVPKVRVYAKPDTVVTATYVSANCASEATKTFTLPTVSTSKLDPQPADLADGVVVYEGVVTLTTTPTNENEPTTTKIENYVVPDTGQFFTSGVWTFSAGDISSTVIIDDEVSECSVVLGDFPTDTNPAEFSPATGSGFDQAAFRSDLNLSVEAPLGAPIFLPEGVPSPCPTS
jgi:prepilin-type N-terminal cleavage/methylation domain-containing protein